jgi:hypothetical protein
MLKAPLCLAALLSALFAGPVEALPLPPDPIAATAAENVRFEARGGAKHRAERQGRRGRSGDCRRCDRGGTAVTVLAHREGKRAEAIVPPSPPPRLTFTMRTDTLGPLRVRLYSSTWVEECEQKHPTFVARTGTFEGEGGVRQRCE